MYLPRRKSIRLKNFDYTTPCAYFITICIQHRKPLLSKIINGQTILTRFGEIVSKQWYSLPESVSGLELDEMVIMPNHLHGILMFPDTQPPNSVKTLGQVIAYLKYLTTKTINQIQNTAGYPVWQRNYYEHIIRNEQELFLIQQYILDNPVQWNQDRENPLGKYKKPLYPWQI